MVRAMIMSVAFYFVPIAYSMGQDMGKVASAEAIIWYDNLIGRNNSGLINGPEYKIEVLGKNTHPFFEQRTPGQGMVYYREQTYLEVPLIYDIQNDKLVLVHRNLQQLQYLIELSSLDVEKFSIWGHDFEKMIIMDSLEAGVGTGYFEVLWDGETYDLIAKRRKVNFPQGQDIRFYQADMYFVKENEKFFQVRAKRHFLQIFPDRKAEIKHFLKENDLKIKNSKVEAMRQLVEYCNTFGPSQKIK